MHLYRIFNLQSFCSFFFYVFNLILKRQHLLTLFAIFFYKIYWRDTFLDYVWMIYGYEMCMFLCCIPLVWHLNLIVKSPEVTLCGWLGNNWIINKPWIIKKIIKNNRVELHLSLVSVLFPAGGCQGLDEAAADLLRLWCYGWLYNIYYYIYCLQRGGLWMTLPMEGHWRRGIGWVPGLNRGDTGVY